MKRAVQSLAAIACLAAAAGAHAQAIDSLQARSLAASCASCHGTLGQAQPGMASLAGQSKNPYLQFTLRGTKAGDRVAILWNDNRGATRRDEATVA